MTVAELIEELKIYPADAIVFVGEEEEKITGRVVYYPPSTHAGYVRVPIERPEGAPEGVNYTRQEQLPITRPAHVWIT